MEFYIGNKLIGGDNTFIIAELSANHNQDINVALKLIEEAHIAGADAIKLQTYTADTITLNSNKEEFMIKGGTIWDGGTLYDLYKKAYTPWEWTPTLMKKANDLGIIVSVWLNPSVATDDNLDHKILFDIHRKATTHAIHKAMNNEPSIDWLLDNQESIVHKYFQMGLDGKI